jgi:nucleoside-diphosphate-sugar epimerase
MLYVTGITGHTGRWFLQRLVRERCAAPLRCVVRDTSDLSVLMASGLDVELVKGDLTAPGFLNSSMSGVDTVLHIAGIDFSSGVMRAALANGVTWAVLVHTTGRYSRYKSASEGYIQTEDTILSMRDRIGVTILRPTMIYGSSRDRNMYLLIDFLYRHRFFPVFGSGANLLQPVLARDLGNAYFDVLARRDDTFNREYDLPGKAPLSYLDLIHATLTALNRRTFVIHLPVTLSIVAAYLYNRLVRNPLISVEQVRRMQEDKTFPYDRAAADFGYAPASFTEGIRDEVAEYLRGVRKT